MEELDQRVLIVLRDGKHVVGTLVSYDQFSNLILHETVERRMKRCRETSTGIVTYYADVPLGLYVVRGDSIVLCGPLVDEDDIPAINAYAGRGGPGNHHSMQKVTLEELAEKTADSAVQLEWDFDTDLIA